MATFVAIFLYLNIRLKFKSGVNFINKPHLVEFSVNIQHEVFFYLGKSNPTLSALCQIVYWVFIRGLLGIYKPSTKLRANRNMIVKIYKFNTHNMILSKRTIPFLRGMLAYYCFELYY